MRVHDSCSGRPVLAATGERATVYVCGITPYDATHIGHAATYLAFDLLVRAWLDAGHEVTYASNVTDVDDPLLERAAATGVDWRDLAATQEHLFATDMTALRVIPPDVYRGAVETIPEVVEAVETMLGRGQAYRVPLEDGAGGDRPDLGDVYADLAADPDFGAGLGLDREQMGVLFAERGGDPERAGKRGRLDPLLWRRERPAEPAWDGRGLGTGRPGWHIECAVIAKDGIGLPFDVLGGGADLMFPHHEMSSSHDRLLGGAGPRLRMHAALVSYAGAKMSKSLGNLVLVSGLREAGTDPMAIRLAILDHHYRDEWEWTDADIELAAARLGRWRAAVALSTGPDACAVLDAVRAAMAADLASPAALKAVDAWAEQALAAPAGDASAPGLVARTVDALLGVAL